jgi:hypothetical protein
MGLRLAFPLKAGSRHRANSSDGHIESRLKAFKFFSNSADLFASPSIPPQPDSKLLEPPPFGRSLLLSL